MEMTLVVPYLMESAAVSKYLHTRFHLILKVALEVWQKHEEIGEYQGCMNMFTLLAPKANLPIIPMPWRLAIK